MHDRLDTLEAIAASHRRHGHVQEVIVQNFLPKPGTSMHASPPCPTDEFLWTIAAARLVLPPSVHLQAPPNLSDDLGPVLASGIDDWGGVSPVTADHVNPERAWPDLDLLRAATEAGGYTLAPRLTLYPEFATGPDRWLAEPLRFPVLDASDAEGLGRDHPWCSGGDAAPAGAPADAGPPAGPPVATLRPAAPWVPCWPACSHGEEVGEDEIVTLFSARGSEVRAVADVADHPAVRGQRRRGDLRGQPQHQLHQRLHLQVPVLRLLQGTAVPEPPGRRPTCSSWGRSPTGYARPRSGGPPRSASKAGSTRTSTATTTSRSSGRCGPAPRPSTSTASPPWRSPRGRAGRRCRWPSTSTSCSDAGLKTLPGTAAEILDDEVRAVLCPDKIDTEEWLHAHRTAHGVGLRSNVTIMFGAVEHPRSWARHLVRTRALQHETGGFTEFVPLPFVHMATPMYIQRKSRRGPTFRETLLMHAVGRIAYRGAIDNIQVSWVKMGADGVRQLLRAGVNDLGGTLMDENISRAAGAEHGQMMGADGFRDIVEPLGRTLAQRTTLYGRVARPEPLRRLALN